MLSDSMTVAILRLYQKTGLVTRVEVGHMIGAGVGRIAGLCNRNQIKPWPDVSQEVKEKRTCCFLTTLPTATVPRLCGQPTHAQNGFLCETHEELINQGNTWSPGRIT